MCRGGNSQRQIRIWASSLLTFLFSLITVQESSLTNRCSHVRDYLRGSMPITQSCGRKSSEKAERKGGWTPSHITHLNFFLPLCYLWRSSGSEKVWECKVSSCPSGKEENLIQNRLKIYHHKTGTSYLKLSHQTVSCCMGGDLLTQVFNRCFLHKQ